MRKINWYKLLFSLILPFLAGAIGSYFTFPAIPNWYAGLNKPFFSPPNWLFGPVWTLLYIAMGIAMYLFWISKTKKQENEKGIRLYLIQLALNTFWSIAFFGLRSPLLAFVTIVILWVLIFKTIKQFYKYSPTAGKLLIPYILWVSFASLLNLSIIVLNQG